MFDISAYSPAISSILREPRLPELGPGKPNLAMRSALDQLTPEKAFPSLSDRSMALGCISGLWLLHDFLDESHTISQELHSATGSYWHAIMHRREPDASNSKYWFRQVGSHPVLSQMASEVPALGYAVQSAFDFIDFCERVRGSGSPEEMLARRVQLLEWQLLFDWCYRQAVST